MRLASLAAVFLLVAGLTGLQGQFVSTIPANAHRSAFGSGWECDRGFRRTGAVCQAVVVPTNAHLDFVGNGWECDRGFHQVGTGCQAVSLPANAQLDFVGHGWECRRGFRQVGLACEAVGVPLNAHLDFVGHGWECDRGFQQVGGSCQPVTVPTNAHLDFVGHGWECDKGFRRQMNGCAAMTAAEILAAQRAEANLITQLRQRQQSLDLVDWSSCSSELDRLRRAARDAGDQATTVESAKDEYETCQRRQTSQERADNSCASKRTEYESARSEADSQVDTVMSRIKSVTASCGR